MKRNKRHLGIKIICCLLVIILCAAIVLFGKLGVTLLTVKTDEEHGIYVIDYREDYKLQALLDAGGVKTQDELAKYLIRILLKGLPIRIDYDVPSLACSTFFAQTPDGKFLLGRNLDNQETDLAVVKTSPKDGYRSVSVVNLSFLGYDQTHTPAKLKDRIVAMGAPYFPLDGINEKGFAVGVLQLQAPPTDQNTDKVDVDTTLAIRVLLDKAATVEEAIALLGQFDMHASAGGCYHFQMADATGRSAVVEYVGDELVVVEPEDGFLAATNFYLSDVPFDYEAQGLDRYAGMKETLQEKNSVLTADEAMALLQKVALTGTAPDAQGRSYSTQWSSVYDLSSPSLLLCADRNAAVTYRYSPLD
ncbi:MAG: linear amide C-N hydrolase [Clostridia bacterium]|nr:linear amide C-N hydrolase [Clostridia bacterium]